MGRCTLFEESGIYLLFLFDFGFVLNNFSSTLVVLQIHMREVCLSPNDDLPCEYSNIHAKRFNDDER